MCAAELGAGGLFCCSFGSLSSDAEVALQIHHSLVHHVFRQAGRDSVAVVGQDVREENQRKHEYQKKLENKHKHTLLNTVFPLLKTPRQQSGVPSEACPTGELLQDTHPHHFLWDCLTSWLILVSESFTPEQPGRQHFIVPLGKSRYVDEEMEINIGPSFTASSSLKKKHRN